MLTLLESGRPESATHDSLTGLANLRGFLDIGKYLLALSLRLGHEVKAVYVDVDGFGRFNERLGMAAGDRALVEIARALVASFRECDLIGRIGGDEFCVLLSTGADSRLDSRLHRLDDHLHRLHAERMPELRVSVGVSAITYDPKRHDSIEALISDAEQQLRNRGAGDPAGL